MADDYEMRKSSYLSTIHQGIDELLKGAPVWFGEDVPRGFQIAVKNLVAISVSYSDQIREYTDFVFDREREVIDLSVFLESLSSEIRPLASFADLRVSAGSGTLVYVPAGLFRDALLNLLVCFFQFASDTTEIVISAETFLSSVRIRIDAKNLAPDVPDISKLMKTLYASYEEGGYRFRIGLELPVSDLKKVGGIVDIFSRNDGRDIFTTISLPSYDFLRTVEDIRRTMPDDSVVKKEGDIVVSVEDGLIELILKEKLVEHGYSVKSYEGERLRFLSSGSYKAIIVDYDKVERGLISECDVSDSCGCSKVIVICGEADKIIPDLPFVFFTMPFEVEKIVDVIEAE